MSLLWKWTVCHRRGFCRFFEPCWGGLLIVVYRWWNCECLSNFSEKKNQDTKLRNPYIKTNVPPYQPYLCTHHDFSFSLNIKQAREEVQPKLNQFGGEPKSSTVHLLMKVVNHVVEALEDNRSAVVLSAVDFSKAFNRLEYPGCLQTVAKKWGSTDIIALLGTFLEGRTMTVRVGKQWSALKSVNAEAPQGSVSVVFSI